ncbi:hypothetical protein E2C01_027692 [Portunus trituberculatus]|uniref:Uncharacterized protein n=1 Tax=Portunus trituberculatus TaxID=210409 RepID=A0A5B7ELU9_PORTR|nr:hypothetical protein [Portunus trituberculatus]
MRKRGVGKKEKEEKKKCGKENEEEKM